MDKNLENDHTPCFIKEKFDVGLLLIGSIEMTWMARVV